jgi:glucokinase
LSPLRLVADIGGTNARFVWVEEAGRLGPFWSTRVAEHASFMSALEAFLAEAGEGKRDRIGEVAVAAAGPVDAGEVQLTNAPWRIREAEIAQVLPGAGIKLYNDLEAAALALPFLEPQDVAPIGPPRQLDPGARLLVVNVGTGFNSAAAIPLGSGRWASCPSESGHMSLTVQSDEERRVIETIGTEAPTVETVLSGAGFVDLYRALGGAAAHTAETIIERHAEDSAAREAVRLATIWLARVAGDLVLAAGAWGGVCLTGGIVNSWRAVADMDLFIQTFVAKGKMRTRMSTVPAVVIQRRNLALMGLSRAHLHG